MTRSESGQPAASETSDYSKSVWAKALWQIAPRCARPQDRKDAVENTLSITRGTPRCLFRTTLLMAAHS